MKGFLCDHCGKFVTDIPEILTFDVNGDSPIKLIDVTVRAYKEKLGQVAPVPADLCRECQYIFLNGYTKKRKDPAPDSQ